MWENLNGADTSSSPGKATTVPSHVHVYKDSRFVVKWDLENHCAMKGAAPASLVRLIAELAAEGKL